MHTSFLCSAILQPVCVQYFPDPGDPKAEWEPETCLYLWFAHYCSSANSGGFCAVVLLYKLLLLIVSAKKENLFAIQAAGPERGQLKSKVHHRMHWYQKWGDTCDVHCRCSGILLELGDNITHITAFTWDNTVTFQNHGAWEKYLISHGDGDSWEGQCSFPSGKVCLPSVQFSCRYIRQSSLQGAYY